MEVSILYILEADAGGIATIEIIGCMLNLANIVVKSKLTVNFDVPLFSSYCCSSSLAYCFCYYFALVQFLYCLLAMLQFTDTCV
jgi:hypothetical protein